MHEKPSVLIVDDSRTIRAAVGKYLREHFNPIDAADGEAGWAALMEHPEIEIVISDIQMPILDGYGLICRIRASGDENVRNKPILVITSADDEKTRERAYACGANDFVLKPLEFGQLATRLTTLLSNNSAAVANSRIDMEKYESAIEDAVLEVPDVTIALSIINGEEQGNIDPYIVDLCLEVLPLLQYFNDHSTIDIKEELSAITAKLKSQAF